MQRHECNKHNYLCINDSLKNLFPCENQDVTGKKSNELPGNGMGSVEATVVYRAW
jgi:hypothetical protein